MYPKHYETHKNMSLGSNGMIGYLHCEKFRRDFIARTFALIAPVRPDLHRVSCSNEMVLNVPKHYEINPNMSLGSNGMDRVPSLLKILTRLCCTNYCINCTSSTPSFVQQQNCPKCTQTLWNALEHGFRNQWYGSGAFVAKNSDATSWHELLH